MRLSWLKQSPFRKSIVLTKIVSLPFLFLGVFLLYQGHRHIELAKASSAWPTAQGVIRQSSVEYEHRNKGGGYYLAQVKYRFTVDGTDYSGERVNFGADGSGDSGHEQNIVNRYPATKSVTVFYMPGKPQVCVLEPGVKDETWGLSLFGGICFVGGVLLALFLPWRNVVSHKSWQEG